IGRAADAGRRTGTPGGQPMMETVAVGPEIAPAVAAVEAEARMSLAAGGEPWLTELEGRGGAFGAAGAGAPSETGFRSGVIPDHWPVGFPGGGALPESAAGAALLGAGELVGSAASATTRDGLESIGSAMAAAENWSAVAGMTSITRRRASPPCVPAMNRTPPIRATPRSAAVSRVMPPLVVIATLAIWPSPAGNLKPDQSDSGNSTYSLAGSASRPTR